MSDLINTIGNKINISRKIAENTIDIIFNSIEENLKSDGRVEIRGFGSFAAKHYKGYQGRNPKTGLPIEVKPKSLAVFRMGRELKLRLNKNS
jgi:integration host factor subunit beta